MDADTSRALAHASATIPRQQPTRADVLDAVTASVRDALPQFEHAGVALSRRDRPISTLSGTTDLVRELADAQYGSRQGPTYDCAGGVDLVVAAPLRHDSRWPAYVRTAAQHGVRAQVSLRLFADRDGTTASLDLISVSRDEVTSDDLAVASFFARRAAAAFGRARRADRLTDFVEERQLLARAIGIVMQRHGLDADAAEQYLWRASSFGGTRLHTVAAALVAEVVQTSAPVTEPDAGAPHDSP